MKTRSLRALFSRQFLVFVTGGIFSALVDIGSMTLLLRAGVGTLTATTFGFALGLAVNYMFHLRMTFATRNTRPAMIRFVVIVGINYGITLVFIFVAQYLDGSVVIGKAASLPVVAINGFLLSKFWAFR